MRIYTITLSPAYDIHAYTEKFIPYGEQLAEISARDIGGKGINISRALSNAGVGNTSIVVLGKENGDEFKKKLNSKGISPLYFEREGRIRENITLHSDGDKETRISFKGFSADKKLLDDIEKNIVADEDTIITFTGRVPDGISVSDCIDFLIALKDKGGKIVLDSKSFGVKDICRLKPWLIKPNEEEIREYSGTLVKNLDEALKIAREFYLSGIKNVMISLGEQGAVLMCDKSLYSTKAPKIKAVSTIGAGDSAIAGFIAAMCKGLSPAEGLKSAVAFGTAACLTEGTNPPKAEDINKIISKITVKEHTR